MAKYEERVHGIKDISYEEAIANVKDELRRQLIHIYFKDEPDFVRIIENDDSYERIYEDVLDDDGIKEAYSVHCRRRYVVRFSGVLYKFSHSFPPRIGNPVAIELGVRFIALHLKRSEEYQLTKLQRLKFYNKALKMEMMMLEEDLEWNDDLNDDMFNEIQRFERNVEREIDENERLVLKGKSRKGHIELLHYRLVNEYGVEPAQQEKIRKPKGAKSKQKEIQKKGKEKDGEKPKERAGFTSVVKN